MRQIGWVLAILTIAVPAAVSGGHNAPAEAADTPLAPAPAHDAAPAQDAARVHDATPAHDAAPAQDTARVQEAAPVQDAARRLDFFIGEWEAVSYGPNGQIVGRSRGGAKWILDGTLQRHDYLGLDPNGNVVFRGTSLRTYIPATGKWVVHWVMANTPGYTYIDTEWRDGELHGTGYGFDGGGEFQERYRYWEITDTSYTFQLERTYDGGETWQTYPLTKATKVADEALSMG